MPEFIPAGKLKTSFGVFGHFYSIKLKSGESIDCRSVLEIVTNGLISPEIDRLAHQLPDAIFIMMNPGSSTPLVEVNNIVSEDRIDQLGTSLVLTKPDTTQYQVMRLMHYLDWGHVRVLNISDMRDPKSGSFVQRYTELEHRTGFAAHSLFAGERDEELKFKLKRKAGAPIVCAWGVSADLDPLITRCLGKMGDVQVLRGLSKQNATNKYYHPLPTLQKDKEEWVGEMLAQLGA